MDTSTIVQLIPLPTLETLYMVGASTLLAVLFGFPIGVILYLSDKGGLLKNLLLYKTLSSIVDLVRSFPFAILLVSLIPITRMIVGTSLGTTASIVPLAFAATPYFARLAEFSLKSVSKELVDAAIVMGSNPLQIIRKVVVPEALPRLVIDLSNTLINLTGYSAMAGMVGGGGLGKVAIDYGYYRFNTLIMITTVAVLVLLVLLFQKMGSALSQKILNKRGF